MLCGPIILKHLALHLKLLPLTSFFTKVTDSVREVFSTFVNDPNGILCEPLENEEVARVCSTLKLGVSGVEIDYEHI